MFKSVIKVLSIIIMVAALGYFAVCSFSAFKSCNNEAPDLPKAAYSVTVKYTKLTIFTDKLDIADSLEVGKKVYTLHGYWEAVKGKFVFKNIDLVLDEKVFGPIVVGKR